MKQFEPYFQDDWKVTRRLTLNLGMRYTWNQMFHNINKPHHRCELHPQPVQSRQRAAD